MDLYVFKIHPKCSYRDGLLLVAAENFEDAKDIAINIKNKDVWQNNKSKYAKRSFLEKDAEIVEKFEELDKTQYHDIWYVSLVIEDIKQKRGFLRVAYHDG